VGCRRATTSNGNTGDPWTTQRRSTAFRKPDERACSGAPNREEMLTPRFSSGVYVVPLGISLANVRSPAITWKIWFRLVTGWEAEMQLLLPPVAV